MLFLFARFAPAGVFDAAFPPIEELTIERVSFDQSGLHLQVVNGGPEPITIAQVTVDEAVWNLDVAPDNTVERLGRATVNIPYPWVEGDPLGIAPISSSGVIFEHGVDVAAASPEVGGTFLATFTLPGVYVGVIPVLIGLLWFLFLRRFSVRWLNFFLNLTIGLLLFLGVDAVDEAIDNAEGVAGAFQGIALAAVGFILAFLAISVVGPVAGASRSRGRGATHARVLHRRRHRAAQPGRGPGDRRRLRDGRHRAGDLPGHRLRGPRHHRGSGHRRTAGAAKRAYAV